MKICFIGNSGSYKTSIAYYLWSNVLSYYRPTVGYQVLPYKEHLIYDCGGSRYNLWNEIPYEDIDLFIIFVDLSYHITNELDSESETLYDKIRYRNKRARLMGVVSPSKLEDCIAIAEDIKKIL